MFPRMRFKMGQAMRANNVFDLKEKKCFKNKTNQIKTESDISIHIEFQLCLLYFMTFPLYYQHYIPSENIIVDESKWKYFLIYDSAAFSVI